MKFDHEIITSFLRVINAIYLDNHGISVLEHTTRVTSKLCVILFYSLHWPSIKVALFE